MSTIDERLREIAVEIYRRAGIRSLVTIEELDSLLREAAKVGWQARNESVPHLAPNSGWQTEPVSICVTEAQRMVCSRLGGACQTMEGGEK